MDISPLSDKTKSSHSRKRNQERRLSAVELLPVSTEATEASLVAPPEIDPTEEITEVITEEEEEATIGLKERSTQDTSLLKPNLEEELDSTQQKESICKALRGTTNNQDPIHDLVMKAVTDTKEDMEEASPRSLTTKKSTRARQDEAVEEEEDTVEEDTWSLDTSATTMTSPTTTKSSTLVTTTKRRTTIYSETTRCTTHSLTEVTVSVLSVDLSEGELQECHADISEDRHEQEEEDTHIRKEDTSKSLDNTTDLLLFENKFSSVPLFE